MKKLIAWLLLLTLTVGLFAGCRKTEVDPTEPDVTVSEADIEGITAAIDYLKGFYKDEGSETPVDYERFGIIRIGGVPYTVVWTVDVSEDLIKIVVNDDGTVTIDVNEDCQEDTPYVLTATITDAVGNSVSHSWNHILPKAVDMVAIVKAAYALKPGESLPYESVLKGKIIQIKTPYSEEYKNITVVIEVEGAEDMPIECYRLKGEGADKLAIGDIITVTGTLKNYNGTIEFDSGCMLVEVIPGERVEAPDDMKQIVDEAYALGANKTLPYEATLTGEIIEIGTPYDSYYGNISVTIVVEGREDKPIVCYRMKGKGCENLKVTDVITVKGYITNYVGSKGYSTIEFTAGCQLLDYKPGAGVYAPTDPVEIMRIAKALGANKKTKFEATLTGVITKVNSPYSSQYGNVSVTMDVNGTNDEIYCYRIKGNGADKIGVGDTITVKGYITNYVGESGYSTIEFVAGSKLISYKKGVKEELPSYNNIIAEAPVVGTAYKLGMEQKNNAGSPWYYFDGKMDSYYLGTNEDGRKAIDVYIAEISGGYSLYFKDASGATKYINIIEAMGTDGKLHVNMQIADKATSVYTFNSEKKVLTTKVGEEAYCIGTYNNYTTMAARKLSGCDMPAYLLTLEALTGPASMEEAAKKLEKEYPDGYDADKKLPTEFAIRDDKFTVTWKLETTNEAAAKIVNGVVVETSQEQAVNYKLTATITKVGTTETVEVIFNHTVAPIPKDPVKNPAAETAYKFGMSLPEKTALFTGKMSGNFLATIDDSSKAVNVYLESVTDGYLLYFMDGETKTYIRTYETDAENSKAKVELTAEKPAEIYTYDKDRNILVYTKGENSYFLGTYGSYDTISASSTFYITGDNAANLDVTQYPARFYPENIKVEPAPIIEPDKEVLTIAEVIEFASTVPHNKYTTNKYKVTGVITEVSNSTYGNMKITDGNGKTLTLYGTYDATGANRYDAMDVKPVAGDTITVYGIIGQYNGTPQLKDGWIVDHDAVNPPTTEPGTTEPDTTTPSEPVPSEPTGSFVIYNAKDSKVVTTTNKPYSGKDQLAVADATLSDGKVSTAATDVLVVTKQDNGDGTVSFKTADGKFLHADGTHVNLSASENDNTKFVLEETTGGYFIKLANATYQDKAQYLEYYAGSLTSYGMNTSKADIYTFAFYSLADGNDTTEPGATEPGATEPGTTEPATPGYVTENEFEAGKVYKLGVIHETKGYTIFFNGQVANTYYGGSTQNMSEGVDVIMVGTDGGYHLSYKDPTTEATKYINIADSGEHINFLMEDSASTVYIFNEELDTLETVIGEKTLYLGSESSYATFRAGDINKVTYVAHLFDPEATPDEPTTTEPTTTEPDTSEPADSFVIYNAKDGKVVTSTNKPYSGKDQLAVADATLSGNKVSTAATDVLVVTKQDNGDGTVSFKTADGKYLHADGTHVNLSDSENDNTKFVLEETTGGYFIKLANATYQDKAQYLEYYAGSLTSYGMNSSKADIYTFAFYALDDGNDTTEPDTTEPTTTEPTPTQPGGPAYSETYDLKLEKDTQKEQYEEDTRVLDDVVTLNVVDGYINGNVRIYNDTSNNHYTKVTISSARAIEGASFTAGNKTGVLKVEGSNDGAAWTDVANVSITDTDYLDYPVDFGGNTYTYLRLSFTGGTQLRLTAMTLNFAGSEPGSGEPGATEPQGTEPAPSEPNTTEPNTTEPDAGEPGAPDPSVSGTKYVVWSAADGKAWTALAENKSYGYMSATNVTVEGGVLIGYNNDNIFIFVDNGDDTFKIVDCYNRYIYMSDDHNSFNVSAEVPAEGGDWSLTDAGNGAYYVTNVLKNKTLCFDTQYGSFGSYADKKSVITLTAPTAPVEQDAVAALYAEYSNLYNGVALVDTIQVRGVTFNVTWSVESGQEAVSITNNVVAIVPQATAVDYKIKAQINSGDEVAEWTGTVAAAVSGVTGYTPVTSASEITAGGDFVIAALYNGSYYMLNTTISGKINATEITVENNVITSNDPAVWTVAGSGSGITLSNGSSFLDYNSSTNFKSNTTAAVWNVADNGDGTVTVTHGTTTDRAVAYQHANNGNAAVRFGAYKTSNDGSADYSFDLVFFKYVTE